MINNSEKLSVNASESLYCKKIADNSNLIINRSALCDSEIAK